MLMAHVVHIFACIQSVMPLREVNHNAIHRKQGFATMLLWFSLTKYLLSNSKFSTFPKTIVASTKVVFYGILGILPAAIGIGMFTTVNLYGIFRH